MRPMMKKAMEDSFAGESMAHMKYLIFSEIAEKEGFPNVARLFEATAYAEQVHATNHARTLDYLKKTPDNLQTGIDGETYEFDEMYPAYHSIATLVGDKKAEKAIYYALEAEKIHAKYYEDAKKSVLEGKDIQDEKIYICPVCGYTHIGTPPDDKCPVCFIPKERYKVFG